MKIEKGIPAPEDNLGSAKYPYSEMEIGDSVFFDVNLHDQNKARIAARVYSHRTGKKFTARKVEGGVRIWRIE